MKQQENTPLISKTAFACPHCGAYSSQHWYRIFAASYPKDSRTPHIPNVDTLEDIEADADMGKEGKALLKEWIAKMLRRHPFIESSELAHYNPPIVQNCNLSACFNCREVTVWVHDKIAYPATKIDIKPNRDLPDEVIALFDEAAGIVDASPRGAAALLRLSVQILCKHLGEGGRDINKDIGNLVKQGLNPMVQKALDVVRVVGNEAVHPGEINLNDNKDVAVKLFHLINLICDQMISHPKQVEALYDIIPPKKLEGIQQRDKKPDD